MKVLQTHVLVRVHVILGNESIRLQNTQTLEIWKTTEKHSKQIQEHNN